jgi:hypothetical protein
MNARGQHRSRTNKKPRLERGKSRCGEASGASIRPAPRYCSPPRGENLFGMVPRIVPAFVFAEFEPSRLA